MTYLRLVWSSNGRRRCRSNPNPSDVMRLFKEMGATRRQLPCGTAERATGVVGRLTISRGSGLLNTTIHQTVVAVTLLVSCALRTPFDFKALWTLDLARSARRAAWRRIYVGGKNENQSLRIRGIEPRSVPWEGTMIPLHQMRLNDLQIFVNIFVHTERSKSRFPQK